MSETLEQWRKMNSSINCTESMEKNETISHYTKNFIPDVSNTLM